MFTTQKGRAFEPITRMETSWSTVTTFRFINPIHVVRVIRGNSDPCCPCNLWHFVPLYAIRGTSLPSAPPLDRRAQPS